MSAKWTFWAWEQEIKKAPLKLTLLQLANNSNDDGVSWYSIPKMAGNCSMSERAFQGHVKTLEKDGFLNIKERAGTSSIYTLKSIEIELHDQPTPAESAPHPRRICTTPPQNLHHTPAESADDPNNELNNELKSDPNTIEELKIVIKTDCEFVFSRWQEIMGKSSSKLTKDRRSKIEARLKEGFTPDQLIEAIRGCKKSDYHMGKNDSGTVFNSIDLIFRNAGKVEEFIGRNTANQKFTQSQQSTPMNMKMATGPFQGGKL
ncbi:MAG: hypothetical protein ACJAYB_000083 [Psychromonas sp.]|jgi:hypothetical protein